MTSRLIENLKNKNSICIIDIYSKYVWVVPLKDKNSIINTSVSLKVLDESNNIPIKALMDKTS